jgi:hypothetical protein
MRAVLVIVVAGCGAPARWEEPRDPDYGRPFEVVLVQYSVPVGFGLAAPGTVGGWDEKPTKGGFVRGITHRPRPDDVDSDFVNYVLHPLAGSETHVLARSCGWSFLEAVAFDFFGSIVWEYVFENVFERPSLTDLLVTAPFGAILGELRWQAAKAGILPGLMGPTRWDPFVTVEEGEFLFGVELRW